MKKFTFFLAVLFSATFANAQITLEHTFNGWYSVSSDAYADQYNFIEAPYFYEIRLRTDTEKKVVVNLYDTEDFSLYKSIPISTTFDGGAIVTSVSKNIFTQDNKVCFCLYEDDYENANETLVYNEDGIQIASLYGTNPCIVKIKGKYRLINRTPTGSGHITYIYSLPGNGEPSTDIVTPITPKRSSARKIARDGQVLVETETSTYTMRGQEIK